MIKAYPVTDATLTYVAFADKKTFTLRNQCDVQVLVRTAKDWFNTSLLAIAVLIAYNGKLIHNGENIIINLNKWTNDER